jgi:hypothetical protein
MKSYRHKIWYKQRFDKAHKIDNIITMQPYKVVADYVWSPVNTKLQVRDVVKRRLNELTKRQNSV